MKKEQSGKSSSSKKSNKLSLWNGKLVLSVSIWTALLNCVPTILADSILALNSVLIKQNGLLFAQIN